MTYLYKHDNILIMVEKLHSKGGVVTRVAENGEHSKAIADLFTREIYGHNPSSSVGNLHKALTSTNFGEIDSEFIQRQQAKNQVGITVDKSGKLLGAVAIVIVSQKNMLLVQPTENIVEITTIATIPDARRKGYGRKMIQLAEAMAQNKCGKNVKINVQPINISGNSIKEIERNNRLLQKFYKRNGYKPDEEETGNHPVSFMLKDLGISVLSKQLGK